MADVRHHLPPAPLRGRRDRARLGAGHGAAQRIAGAGQYDHHRLDGARSAGALRAAPGPASAVPAGPRSPDPLPGHLGQRAEGVSMAPMLSALALALAADSTPAIVPRPARMTVRPGAFTLTAATAIVTDRATRPLGELLADYLLPATGFRLPVRTGGSVPAGAPAISIRLDSALARLGDEGYRLDASPSHVAIRAYRAAGAFYGIETLRQLLPPAVFRQAKVDGMAWRIPAVAIEDVPRFAWRGVHLDVARHFMPKEIEMPGHSQAAIAAYPELGNRGDTLPVWTSWGVDQNILNPDDATIQFAQNVLTEVMGLFPGPWIHTGGDEAPKAQWKASPLAQARIRELGLKDEEALQGYFTRRMDEFLTSHG